MRKKDELSLEHTCMRHAHPEEMVFVLLGRDPAAPVAIRAWVEERLSLGKNIETDAQIVEALECARTMEAEGRRWVSSEDPVDLSMLPPDATKHPAFSDFVDDFRQKGLHRIPVQRLDKSLVVKSWKAFKTGWENTFRDEVVPLILPPGASKHAGFCAFIEGAKTQIYNPDQLRQMWRFFTAGWTAGQNDPTLGITGGW